MNSFDALMEQARKYLEDGVFADPGKAAELFTKALKIAPADSDEEEAARKGRMEALFREYSKTHKVS
jgi:formiminotetrahydrofolate cyclodeaminase